MGLRGVRGQGSGIPQGAEGFNQDVLCLGTNFSSSARMNPGAEESLGNALGSWGSSSLPLTLTLTPLNGTSIFLFPNP